MAKFSSRAALAFCALALCSITRLATSTCFFDNPNGLLSSNALVTCHEDLEVAYNATARCPLRVNGSDYIWHPRPITDGSGHINAYVGENGKLRSAPLSNVIRTEDKYPFIWLESDASRTDIKFKKPLNEMIALTENRLIFICGPRSLVLSDALQRHIYHFSVTQPKRLPWTPVTPMTQEISKIGHGLGVFFLNRGTVHLPLQGCGSRPSPLFAVDDEVTVDPVTGTRSCVADPMSKSPIGFLCEGRVEPDDCMRFLLDANGGVVTAPTPRYDMTSSFHRPWSVAKYFHQLALPPFNGECRCTDPKTGRVKAKIEIRSKTEYVCDIARMIERNRASPISGPWCSVVLHPGSTLTIRFPTTDGDSASYDHSLPGPSSRQTSVYEYETEFLPNDLSTLRQLASVYDFDIYEEVLYHEAIAGDALELDVSQMSLGEVKLRYHLDKPLALLHGTNSFNYHWALKSTKENTPNKIRATVNISFAFSHQYDIIGCDRGTPSVFDPNVSKSHCSVKSMGNGIGDVYECNSPIKEGVKRAGIYCRQDEELLPPNCESMGYDLHKNRMISIPGSVRNATPYPIRGFQVFSYFFRDYSPVSYAYFCVDQRGYETSRLVVESHHHEEFTCRVRHAKVSHTPIPYIFLPWSEVELSSEGSTSPTSLMLKNISRKSVGLHVGKTVSITCGIEGIRSFHGELECDCLHPRIDENLPATWLPTQPEEFYYSVNKTSDAIELVKMAYDNSLATTPGGFKVGYPSDKNGTKKNKLVMQTTLDAILISKNPLHKQNVPITFVCGKAPERSDLSILTGNVSTSNTSAQPSSHVMGLSTGYTWNVVQVNVETTDPYMQGCGVTYASTELFKPETPKLYDADGNPQFGCKIDLQAAKEAAFYCPAPYVLDPPNCFSQVLVDGEVKNTRDISQSLVISQSNHFMILYSFSGLVGPGEKLRQTPPLECRCVTIKGVVLSTIQIGNYYSK
ncbi:hypothetical protein, conserved [Babesia ovata]|uniref:6-Cys domain-containing protein n=1 Tax=Babesia ovata TaxID=189622 RepID=A0A2H6KGQ0_9APIC|nr:uncharacterized protein BOVATA_036590 [Babesia ovata]GBE62166.1 hypothetical protein, conserved [Babesia ovata]